jgi:hypothetical protein
MMISKERVLEKFMASPMFVSMAREAEAEEEAKGERKAKAEELASLRRQRPVLMEKLAKEEKEAVEAMKKAEEAFKEAKRHLGIVQGRCFSEAWVLDQRVREIESFLLSTTPRVLRDQLSRKEAEIERLRSKPVSPRILPDYPEGINLDPEEYRRLQALPSELHERRDAVESVKKEIEQIKAGILKGE